MFSFLNKKPNKNIVFPEFWENYAALFTIPLAVDENSRFIVLDTETTGFDYEQDRMLCIGAISLSKGQIEVKDSFESFITQAHYNKESATIHGILKNEKIKRNTEIESLQSFLMFIGNAILIAHHAVFDITMINKALERNGLPKLKNKYLDTVVLYKKSLIRSPLIERKDHYSLDELADKFNISKKDRHTALGNAYITALLFLKISKKIKEKTGSLAFKKLL